VNSYLLRFALLGIPSIFVLWLWKRAGIRSRLLYGSSWTNVVFYSIWLVMGLTLNWLSRLPHRPPLFDALIGFLIALPLIGALSSLFLLTCTLLTKGTEQKIAPAASSVLMFVLWASSWIAPN